MFINTHPKSILQTVGLPNFVDKDILNTKYIISILKSFHLLGLNVIYVILPGDDTHNNEFLCYDISDVLVKLKEVNTKLCQLVIKKELYGKDSLTFREVEIEEGKKVTWAFDSYKISPYLNLIYKEKE